MTNPLASLHAMRGDVEAPSGCSRGRPQSSTSSAAWAAACRTTRRSCGCSRGGPSCGGAAARRRAHATAMGDTGALATTHARCSRRRSMPKGVWTRRGAVPLPPRRPRPTTSSRRRSGERRGEDPRAPGAARGRDALARTAVGLIAPTDLLSHHGDAMLDLARGARACRGRDEARDAVRGPSRCTSERATSPRPRARSRLLNVTDGPRDRAIHPREGSTPRRQHEVVGSQVARDRSQRSTP